MGGKGRVCLCLLLAVALCALSACGGAKETTLQQTWQVSSAEVADEAITLRELSEVFGDDFAMTFRFAEGDEVTLSISGIAASGTYTVSGSEVRADFGVEQFVFAIEEDTLRLPIEEPVAGVRVDLILTPQGA